MITVASVSPHSPAERCGLLQNDIILSVNGNEVCDVLDFRFHTTDKRLELKVKRGDEVLTFSVKKGEYEDLGVSASTGLMDEKRRCRNSCIFCFIDQNPCGMRETIYFKDDDERLSFLQGNYVTLTNLTDKEIERIIAMRLSPINISVHTTNPELRVKMMGNRFAGDVLRFIPKLDRAGIKLNLQLVLCRGINDGKELTRTLTDLCALKNLESCACVPCGLTAHREGLYPLTPYDKESAEKTIEIIDRFGDYTAQKEGVRRFFASDEFYLLAEKALPEESFYEGYPQIENGVGMLRSLKEEFLDELNYSDSCSASVLHIATGVSAYGTICELIAAAKEKFAGLNCTVHKIENNFFGATVTVSGLITGGDLIHQLKDKTEKGAYLLLPCNMFKADENVFLDNITCAQVEKALNVKIIITGKDGYDLCQKVLSPL